MENNTTMPTDNITTMMQAIIQIANGQFNTDNKLTKLEGRVDALESKPEKILAKMFEEYITLKPEELTLANTMGYTYNGVIDVMSITEIKTRIRRLQFMFGIQADNQWRKKLYKSIGKNYKEITMEAQAFNIKRGIPFVVKTLYDAIESVQEYLKWGTVLILELENENGIYHTPYNRYQIFESQNPDFNLSLVEELGYDEYKLWLNRRFVDIANMMECSLENAKETVYRLVCQQIKDKYRNWEKSFWDEHYNILTNDMEKDFDIISNVQHQQLRRFCAFIIHKILVV